jgi:hypothetical protein
VGKVLTFGGIVATSLVLAGTGGHGLREVYAWGRSA